MKVLLSALLFFMLGAAAQPPKPPLHFSKADVDSILFLAKEKDFTGDLLIIEKGKEVLAYSHGLASETTGAKNAMQTRFNIGSIGKTLTAILIMQLVEQHKLELDKTIDTYLPTVNVPNARKITVRQLLNQTSGLGDFFDSPDYKATTHTIDEHLNLVASMKPVNDTPGQKFSYSNSGFIVLGKLLEVCYKKPYQSIVKERILAPVGITIDTPAAYSTGYVTKDGKLELGESNDPAYWTSAGGLFLSPVELHRIMQALVNGTYLTKATIEVMWKRESHPEGEPPFIHYALGWMVEAPGGMELRGHNGGVPGTETTFRYLPDEDIYIYVFSNRDHGAEELFMQLIFLMLGKKGIHMQPG